MAKIDERKFLEIVSPMALEEIDPIIKADCKKMLDDFSQVCHKAIQDFYDDYLPLENSISNIMGTYDRAKAMWKLFHRTESLYSVFVPIPVARKKRNVWSFGIRESYDQVITSGWYSGDVPDYVGYGAIHLGYHGTSQIATSTPPWNDVRAWWLTMRYGA
jgi:hypothetical protein